MILTPRPGDPKVVLVRPATSPDSYGEGLVADYGPAATRTPLYGARVQTGSSAATGERPSPETPSREVGDRVLFVRGDAGIESGDRVEIDGEPWRVSGKPDVLRGFGPHHVYTRADLKRVTGA